MRIRKCVLFIIWVCMLMCLSVSAHPGKTDENGGHIDHDTGEYHYHHGYPEHDHYDMDGDGDIDCPYDFDDKTGFNSGSSTNNKNSSKSSAQHTTQSNSTNSKNSKNTTVIKEVKEVPSWVYWTFAGLAYLIIHLFFSNLSKKTDLRDMESRHKNEIASIKKACKSEIEARLAAIDQLDVINKKILKAETDLSKARMLVKKENEALSNVKLIAHRMKDAPLEIAFAKNGLPIYWKSTITKPYGDYTVFVNKDKTIYHTDRLCASYTASENHIFNVIGTARPCKRCAEGFFDFDTAPDWFANPKSDSNTNP